MNPLPCKKSIQTWKHIGKKHVCKTRSFSLISRVLLNILHKEMWLFFMVLLYRLVFVCNWIWILEAIVWIKCFHLILTQRQFILDLKSIFLPCRDRPNLSANDPSRLCHRGRCWSCGSTSRRRAAPGPASLRRFQFWEDQLRWRESRKKHWKLLARGNGSSIESPPSVFWMKILKAQIFKDSCIIYVQILYKYMVLVKLESKASGTIKSDKTLFLQVYL